MIFANARNAGSIRAEGHINGASHMRVHGENRMQCGQGEVQRITGFKRLHFFDGLKSQQHTALRVDLQVIDGGSRQFSGRGKVFSLNRSLPKNKGNQGQNANDDNSNRQ